MAISKFNGIYEYMGFAITCGGDAHEWNIEPMWNNIKAWEKFKNTVDVLPLKTLAEAKKWIKANGKQFNEIDFL